MKEGTGDLTLPLSQPRGAWSWLIFALGLGVFLFFQVGLVSELNRQRSLPWEPDDAYSYILKSVALLTCPFQDCQALKDLRPQFTPAPEDPESLGHQKWRRHARLYTNYHPLYSLGLWALAKVEGVSYEDAYRQLQVLGSVGLALALGFFLVSLVGPLAAGISLAILAPLVFPGQDILIQGIFTVVPCTLSLGIGLLMFAYLARREGRPGLTFYGLNLLAMGLHPMGLIHTGLALAFGVACRYPQDGLRSLKGFVPSLVLMAGYWVMIHLVPPFTMLPVPVPEGVSYFREILGNLKKLTLLYMRVFLLENGWPRGLFFLGTTPWWQVIVSQTLGLGLGLLSLRLRAGYGRNAALLAAVLLLAPVLLTAGAAAMLVLVFWRGLFDPEPGRPRLPLLAFTVLFAGMVFACFYVLYPYADTILDRAYVFWALGAAAVMGRGLMLMVLHPGVGPVLPRFVHSSLSNLVPSNPWFWRALLLVFVIGGLLPQQAGDYQFRSIIMKSSIGRYDTAMDATQPRRVLQRTSVGDVILYDRDDMEIILPFFLTYGGLARRAVYLPFLPLPPGLACDPSRVKMLVGMNPFLSLSQPLKDDAEKDPLDSSATLNNYLALPPGATLTLHFDPTFKPETVEILNRPDNLASPGQRIRLTRPTTGKSWVQEYSLPFNTWTECRLPDHQGGTLSLSNPDKEHTMALAGLRFKPGDNPELIWPWEGISEVTWQQPSPARSRGFSPRREISFQGRTYRLTVLQDGGASVVWELTLMPEASHMSQETLTGGSKLRPLPREISCLNEGSGF